MIDFAATSASVFFGPAEAEPSVRGHLLADRRGPGADAMFLEDLRADLRSEKVVVVGAQLLAQRFLFLAVADVHFGSPYLFEELGR